MDTYTIDNIEQLFKLFIESEAQDQAPDNSIPISPTDYKPVYVIDNIEKYRGLK